MPGLGTRAERPVPARCVPDEADRAFPYRARTGLPVAVVILIIIAYHCLSMRNFYSIGRGSIFDQACVKKAGIWAFS